MGMFRQANGGWTYPQFKEFADLCKFYTCNQNVIDFIDFSGEVIPWQLCEKALPELERISKREEFREKGHDKSMLCLLGCMKDAVKHKEDLEV